MTTKQQITASNMPTHFAPAERASESRIVTDLSFASRNPIINTVMSAVPGLLAVLNEQRQILTVNDVMLQNLEITDADKVLGLRPGEALHCVHHSDMPGGCGTTEFCSSCGLALALVASLEGDVPAHRKCLAKVKRHQQEVDLFLEVSSFPMHFENRRFILLFLRDITQIQKQISLDRTFFHELRNLLTGLLINSQVLETAKDQTRMNEMAQNIRQLAVRMAKELDLYETMVSENQEGYELALREISLPVFLDQVEEYFHDHPSADTKNLQLSTPIPDVRFRSDITLLEKIICNMLLNAFEATDAGGTVRMFIGHSETEIQFQIWNHQYIPENTARRVFQRNFTTRDEEGRGLGAYVMKLFGEHYLNGKVTFTSDSETGTTFSFHLPILQPSN